MAIQLWNLATKSSTVCGYIKTHIMRTYFITASHFNIYLNWFLRTQKSAGLFPQFSAICKIISTTFGRDVASFLMSAREQYLDHQLVQTLPQTVQHDCKFIHQRDHLLWPTMTPVWNRRLLQEQFKIYVEIHNNF